MIEQPKPTPIPNRRQIRFINQALHQNGMRGFHISREFFINQDGKLPEPKEKRETQA